MSIDYSKRYEEYIASRDDLINLEPYTKGRDKILHKCLKCGHEWMSTPENIKKPRSCPSCSKNKKITNEEYLESLKDRNICPLAPYINSQTKILHKCLVCAHKWDVVPNSIRQGKGCPKCAGNTKISNTEYLESIKNLNLTPLEDYVSAKTKMLHECKICAHRWSPRPGDVKSGKGCPRCASKALTLLNTWSPEEYTNYLALNRPDLKVVDTYINDRTKLLHKCVSCNYEWQVLPNSIKRGSGCPKCAKYGLDVAIPCYVYLLYFESLDLYKIGISKSVKVRQAHLGVSSSVVHSLLVETGAEAIRIEKLLQTKYNAFLHNSRKLKSGNTETFKNLPINEVIKDLEGLNNGH